MKPKDRARNVPSEGRENAVRAQGPGGVETDGVSPLPDAFKPSARPLIAGVMTRPLKSITDERGRLMELLRSDWPEFEKFGQCYMTLAYPGVVKGWHYHRTQVDHFICVSGMLKLVLYDGRQKSPTRGVINEFFMGVHNPLLVKIPALVYHGFKCISEEECLLINLPNNLYNYKEPDEYRLPAHTPKIPYTWERQDG
jgi:dTDP-4-dehydrorhamnose 3,5-epimerase